MSGSTISGVVNATVTLSNDHVIGTGHYYMSPLTITSAGDIAPGVGAIGLIADIAGGEVLNNGTISGGASAGTGISLGLGTVINSGRVSGGTGYGGVGYSGVAVSLSGGAFINTTGGFIHGGNNLYPQSGVAVSQSGGVLLNEGTIASGGDHGAYGVILTNAILTNSSTGRISGGGGVMQTGGTVVNDGTIVAGYMHGDGVYLTGGGSFGNAGDITGGKGNTRVTAGVGAFVSAGSTLSNTGTIIGGADYAEQLTGFPRGGRTGGDGVLFSGAGNFTNSGVIIGGEGNVDGGGGVSLTSGTLDNSGSIFGGVGNSAYANTIGIGYGGFGVDIAGLLVNDGKIVGGMSGDDGLSGDGVIITAGTLINNQTILGGYSSLILGAPPEPGTAVQASSGVNIVNNGTIAASSTNYGFLGGTAIQSGGGTITNHGLIQAGGIVPSSPFGIIGGNGIALTGAGLVINTGTIAGGRAGGTFASTGYGVLLDKGGTVVNSGYIAAGAGGSQDAIFFGSYASELILDPGARFNGGVLAEATVGNLLELSGAAGAHGTLDMGGSFSGFSSIVFDKNPSWLLQGNTAELAAGQTISGFAASDTIVLQGFAETSFSYVTGAGLELSNGTMFETLDITGSFGNASFLVTAAGGQTEILLCYLQGSRIMTPAGEVPIEKLAIGDAVMTRFNGYQKIKWIGRQSYGGRFIKDNREQIPVRIAAGALGAGLPRRDLSVSPGHSMLLGGVLVLARNLVNGVTITQDEAPDEVHYYQLEFATHDCVLAEGSWSESFADHAGLRGQFHNARDFFTLYPDHETPAEHRMCAPRPEEGPMLEAALRPIVKNAASRTAMGPLRGWIDEVHGSGRINGWAQDVNNPELPVDLEILLDDLVVGRVLACGYRDDLAAANIGQGRCAFSFQVKARMSRRALARLQVRRFTDGAAVEMTADCQAGFGIAAGDRGRRRRA